VIEAIDAGRFREIMEKMIKVKSFDVTKQQVKIICA